MRRRAILQATAASTAIGSLAGCLDSLGGDDTESTTNNTDPTTNDTDPTTNDTDSTANDTDRTTTRPALAVDSKAIETTTTACGAQNTASIEFTDSGATITGAVQASTPCHDAQYVAERVLGGVLQVTIGTTETDAESCQTCIGHVEYTATVQTNRDPHSLVVVHEYTPEDSDEPVTETIADKTRED
ncbi:hypothetical protein [Halorubellus sp. PRR65]|uniref:hypothetical protein n=1 Tax=Halorubellus sp. PRR65 TaxID=3098148 RepID=UPI002B25BFB7|nr:hypothetical protein [Halorubellus sp. PRR65]